MKFLPIILIVAVNLVPAAGLFFGDWNLYAVVMIYWLESFVIGAMNLFRIAVSNGDRFNRVYSSVTFTLVYGFAWFLHGLFLLIFIFPLLQKVMGTEDLMDDALYDSILQTLWIMSAAHLIIFALDVWRKPRAERLPPSAQWKAPFGRVFLMQFVILGGSIAGAEFASIAGLAMVFVALKIGSELLFEYLYAADRSREIGGIA